MITPLSTLSYGRRRNASGLVESIRGAGGTLNIGPSAPDSEFSIALADLTNAGHIKITGGKRSPLKIKLITRRAAR